MGKKNSGQDPRKQVRETNNKVGPAKDDLQKTFKKANKTLDEINNPPPPKKNKLKKPGFIALFGAAALGVVGISGVADTPQQDTKTQVQAPAVKQAQKTVKTKVTVKYNTQATAKKKVEKKASETPAPTPDYSGYTGYSYDAFGNYNYDPYTPYTPYNAQGDFGYGKYGPNFNTYGPYYHIPH